jgi:hypothetical protein
MRQGLAAPPEDVVRDRRRRNEEVRRDRRCGNLGNARSRFAEQKPESWPGGTKLSRRSHREVELKRVREQEHAVGGRTALEVGKVHRVPFADERARPVLEHRSDRHIVSDAEGEVSSPRSSRRRPRRASRRRAPATTRSSSSASRSRCSRRASRCSTVNTSRDSSFAWIRIRVAGAFFPSSRPASQNAGNPTGASARRSDLALGGWARASGPRSAGPMEKSALQNQRRRGSTRPGRGSGRRSP